VKVKTVKATLRNVTEFSVTFLLQSFSGKKAEMFAEKDCVGFGASITVALSFIHILTKRERSEIYSSYIKISFFKKKIRRYFHEISIYNGIQQH